jgi:hypothetical protein
MNIRQAWNQWFSSLNLRAEGSSRRHGRRTLPRRLRLEELENRLVPSTLDLTTPGAMGAINHAVFFQDSPQPTGSGVIHSFVRLQNSSEEQGYNTDARPLQFDENSSPTFTRSLRLSDVPTVTVGGVTYREFLLDINQSHSGSLLSLDELRLYVSGSPTLSGYSPSTGQLADLNPVYDLSAGGGNWVKLDASLSHGSGSGDMLALIPDSAFCTASNQYVYLYSKFGVHCDANGGYEEWAVGATALPVSLSSLSGAVVNEATSAGLSGVTVTLQGVDVLGQSVTMTVTTGANGTFSFADLLAGNYTIIQTPPAGFQDDHNTIGSLGGSTTTNQFIVGVGTGVNGVNYIFGDLSCGSGDGLGGSNGQPPTEFNIA